MNPLALALVLTTLSAPAADKVEKPSGKILAQDLEGRGVSSDDAAAISTAACHALAKHKRFDVLCGDDLRTLMKMNALAAAFNGCKDDACFAKTAKAMEARYVVSGSIAAVGKGFVLSLSMFDVEKSSAVGRSEVKAGNVEDLHGQLDEAVQVLVGK